MRSIEILVADQKQIILNIDELLLMERLNFGRNAWDKNEFVSELPEKFNRSIIIKQSDNILGYCIASRKEDKLHIHRFAVSPSVSRIGIGGRLMQEFIRLSKPFSISLKVEKRNIIAINFYFKMGYFILSEKGAYFEMTFSPNLL